MFLSVGEGVGGGGGEINPFGFFPRERFFSPALGRSIVSHSLPLWCSTRHVVYAKPGSLNQSIMPHRPLHLSSLFSCAACYVLDGKPGAHDLSTHLTL